MMGKYKETRSKNRELQYEQGYKSDPITVGESALKVVVPEETGTARFSLYNIAVRETLSTPLPNVHSCVEIDEVEVLRAIDMFVLNNAIPWTCLKEIKQLAKAIAQHQDILRWRRNDYD